MTRTCSDSRFEIWTSSYVNLPNTREEQDKYVHIIQIEAATDADTYLVEVVDCPPPGE